MKKGSSLKDSSWYEELTRDLFQSLVNQGDVRNINVQHDVTIVGNSGASHQIDVYWEFEIAEVIYRTCIECRYIKSSIKKNHVASFSRIVSDINNANGILVTTKGYQKGARILAAEDNIKLLLVRPLTRQITIIGRHNADNIRKMQPVFDKNDPSVATAISTGEKIQLQSSWEDEIIIIDIDGNPKISFMELKKVILDSDVPSGPYLHTLSNCYLSTSHGILKLHGVQVEIYRGQLVSSFTVGGNHIAKAIIKGLKGDVDKFFHEDGSITVNRIC